MSLAGQGTHYEVCLLCALSLHLQECAFMWETLLPLTLIKLKTCNTKAMAQKEVFDSTSIYILNI